jgi:hypothetical protein
VHADEVDDVPVADAIREVAERAAEDQREAPRERLLIARRLSVEREDEPDGDERDRDEERDAQRGRLVAEEAPRAALVLRRT